MRLELTGRHLTITPATRKFVDQRLAHALAAAQRQRGLGAGRAHQGARRASRRDRPARQRRALPARRGHRAATSRRRSASPPSKIDRQVEKLKGKWSSGRRRRDAARVADGAVPLPRPAAPRERPPHHPRPPLRGEADVDRRSGAESATARTRSSCSATRRPTRSPSCSGAPTAISD